MTPMRQSNEFCAMKSHESKRYRQRDKRFTVPKIMPDKASGRFTGVSFL